MSTVPIEFVVKKRPSSVNDSSKAMEWKTNVATEGKAALLAALLASGTVPPTLSPYADQVTLKVFFFPHNGQYTDIDNGLKHMIDALACHSRPVPPAAPFAPILKNDKTIVRLIAERFAPIPKASLVVSAAAAPILLQALMIASGRLAVDLVGPAKPEYATAIKFEPYKYENVDFW
jgi:hypothetical protein